MTDYQVGDVAEIFPGEHLGVEYEIRREKVRDAGQMPFEFILTVGDKRVTTATRLARRGQPWSSPWVTSLREYAHAYIEGMEH